MAYYISFLKTLSLKLNKHTIHFFYNEVFLVSFVVILKMKFARLRPTSRLDSDLEPDLKLDLGLRCLINLILNLTMGVHLLLQLIVAFIIY